MIKCMRAFWAYGLVTLAYLGAGCGRINYDPLRNNAADSSLLDDAGGDGASNGCPDVTLAIQTAADDGEFNGSVWHPDGESTALFFGHWSGEEYGYFRFQLAQPLPAGATINSATLDLWGVQNDGNFGAGGEFMMVRIENAADAAVVTNVNQQPGGAMAPALSTVTARWPASGGLSWTLNAWNTTTELGALVQDVVNQQNGLAANAHLKFFISYPAPAIATIEVGTEDRARGLGHEARLHLSWCPPS